MSLIFFGLLGGGGPVSQSVNLTGFGLTASLGTPIVLIHPGVDSVFAVARLGNVTGLPQNASAATITGVSATVHAGVPTTPDRWTPIAKDSDETWFNRISLNIPSQWGA